ncbi:unnamed protein product [Boreogadus saida]
MNAASALPSVCLQIIDQKRPTLIMNGSSTMLVSCGGVDLGPGRLKPREARGGTVGVECAPLSPKRCQHTVSGSPGRDTQAMTHHMPTLPCLPVKVRCVCASGMYVLISRQTDRFHGTHDNVVT